MRTMDFILTYTVSVIEDEPSCSILVKHQDSTRNKQARDRMFGLWQNCGTHHYLPHFLKKHFLKICSNL